MVWDDGMGFKLITEVETSTFFCITSVLLFTFHDFNSSGSNIVIILMAGAIPIVSARRSRSSSTSGELRPPKTSILLSIASAPSFFTLLTSRSRHILE